MVTSADLARFIDEVIQETSRDKKSFGGKTATPAIRHANGMVRLRKFVADPKYDPLKPETTLGHNLAVGVLDRSLTESALWPSLKEATNALVNAASDNPGAVDVIAWDGKGTDALAFKRPSWPSIVVQGVDTGSNGEFVAFHLAEDLPGSAAGGPVFKDGRWRGVLFRHPSPTNPKKKIWKFVTLEFVVPLLIQEGK
jgi:hypothetical protein